MIEIDIDFCVVIIFEKKNNISLGIIRIVYFLKFSYIYYYNYIKVYVDIIF